MPLQLSGINAVFYYSTSIFQNVFPDAADRLTVSVGLLNVLLTVITVFLMDRAGRRVLLIMCVHGPFLARAGTTQRDSPTWTTRDDSCEVGMIIFATLFVVSFVKDIEYVFFNARQKDTSALMLVAKPAPVRARSWLNIVCVYAYVASFAIGLGPIPYLILSEIIPTKAVGSGTWRLWTAAWEARRR